MDVDPLNLSVSSQEHECVGRDVRGKDYAACNTPEEGELVVTQPPLPGRGGRPVPDRLAAQAVVDFYHDNLTRAALLCNTSQDTISCR
jgi:hypothetical protein